MTKQRKDNKQNPKKKYELVADLKFKHDLLTNELFHLQKFISLVEFDPSYSNESESYKEFIDKNGLALEITEINGKIADGPNNIDGNTQTGKNTKIRRRQLRDTTLSKDPKLTTTSQVHLSAINILDEIEPLVQERYRQLENSFKTKDNSKVEHVIVKKEKTSKVTEPILPPHPTPVSKAKRSYRKMKKESNDNTHKDINSPLTTEQTPKQSRKPSKTSIQIIENENNQQEDEDSESDSYDFTSSDEEDFKAKRGRKKKLPRLNLIVHPPQQTITNPTNIIKPKFPTLSAYLNSFKSLDDDITIPEYEKYIIEQKDLVAKIKKGVENGALVYDKDTDSLQPITTKETKLVQLSKPDPISFLYKEQNLHVHQDYLINQGIYMSKLFHSSRRARMARAKKVSQMIDSHFKHIAGAEERKLKEEERNRKLLARTTMQIVKKRWNLAEKAYRVLKKNEEEQLQKIKGKEHLSKILEKSSQLLGAQLNQPADEDLSISSDNNDTSSKSDTDSDDDMLSSSSSAHSASSDNEIETHGTKLSLGSVKADSTMDEALSVEELRRKYSGLKDLKLDNNKDSDDESILDESESETGPSHITDESSSDDSISENEVEEGKVETQEQEVGLHSLFTTDLDEDNDHDDSEDFQMSESDEEMKQENDSLDEADAREDSNRETSDKYSGYDSQLSVVDVPVPPLLRGTLRVYQKQGLNWLASLYNNNTNGILADEMGLGKTIQTISLLAYLACEKQIWGPHLIVVPTSVLLNWEMEFKRFAPGLKVLTYYGSPQQRKEKRKGWNKPDAFHVCIVSYQLVVQDQHSFKRKRWEYMVLDEAHNIKNFRSTRWQALLNFNTRRRLLLTGTPLQNNLAELWSLLYFLMPQTIINGKKVSGFADLDAFQQWFGRPVDKLIETGGGYAQDEETKKTVAKLHQVLRPYLLRRLKADVEKQMPAKYEHIVYCRLSKRQRFLYDDFMSRSKTKATLASGNFMSIVNCLMQLRKVCNHPDLFEVRPILTSFELGASVSSHYTTMNKFMHKMLASSDDSRVDLKNLNLVFSENDNNLTSYHSDSISKLKCIKSFVKEIDILKEEITKAKIENTIMNFDNASDFYKNYKRTSIQTKIDALMGLWYINTLKSDRKPVYGNNLIKLVTVDSISAKINSPSLEPLIKPLQTRFFSENDTIEKYAVLTPKAVALDMRYLELGLDDSSILDETTKMTVSEQLYNMQSPFHHLQTKLSIAFPDKSLLQYDCGKLQKLAILLQNLKDNGHRALIFTQMTKVLDVLEQFLNYHGYLYMRLDGATKVEDRQILTERFNTDSKVTVFILSSRSGGLGINLTGADTVIFYDSDWNPAMDKQCQDRCHRIGQTRDVHIYRFVSEHTIESNILKKANQKRELDKVVIQKGDFTTDYFSKLSVKDLLGPDVPVEGINENAPLLADDPSASKDPRRLEKLLAQAEDEDDVRAANLALKEVAIDDEDFTEDVEKKENSLNDAGSVDEYEGTGHVEEYMIRFIANGYYH
ncbi:chromatin-remodeling protein SWR1 NDAI_0C04510 [Naumovozyma dairenensis CBS 421]|uniref:Helicase SWR1 n=1 Tax=Naumovozyma dairenensis (strain ATCC 10597 / BCRC 20456 / CBS 421 / NBRC 0211 / NRRL Y-12639) TaxID=1071378 RepID=G0W8K0_NAUDC|nr:hypothetical protein NDAI_0C04510 [Naumovozyma dairenensis CBS 421]CCD24111.1 hypothetical protein NDAI_0C04510 [Naumovozyma dairenensis CBS 421]